MNVYTSKYSRLPGSSYNESLNHARREYNVIAHSTKRQPYVKSKYFNGNKVFLKVFWNHVMQKRLKERTRRLRFYRAALDVLRHSKITPEHLTCFVILRSHQILFFGQMISTLCYTASTASRKTVRTSACRSRRTSVLAARTSCQSLIGNRAKSA